MESHKIKKSVIEISPEPVPPENKVLLVWVCLICAFLLGQAIQINNGHLDPFALALVCIATAAAFVGVLFSRSASQLTRTDLLLGVIAAVLCVQFTQLFINPPGIYLKPHPEADWRIYYAGLAVAAVAAGGCLSVKPFWGKWTFWVLLACFLVIGFWVIVSAPEPKIDVFYFYREAASALLSGRSPFSLSVPNIYGHTMFYDPSLVREGIVRVGFPYFPITAILATIGHILGDVRYAHLAAAGLSGLLIALLAPGPIGRSLAALYLFTPRGFFVLEQSWVEPFMVGSVALCALAFSRDSRWLGAALGLLLSLKQSLIFFLPLSWLLLPHERHEKVRVVLWAFLVLTLLNLPWLIMDPFGFWHSVVMVQIMQPFRPDALSVAAFFSHDGIEPFSPALAFIVALAASLLAILKSSKTPGSWCVSACLVYLAFFVLNKQAFCNYYYFVIGCACVGASVVVGRIYPLNSINPTLGEAGHQRKCHGK